MTAMKTKPAAGATDDAKAAPRQSKKKLIIIVLVAVLAIGGGAYKFVLAPKPKPAPPAAGDTVKMDPTIVNLSDGHYLKVSVAIQLVKGKATLADFDPSHAAQLVIDEFTGRNRATLTNAERQVLAKQLDTSIDKAYPDEVFAVYFTQFLID